MRDWLYQYHCGAGRGAQQKYKEVCGHWQRRIFRWPRFILVCLGGLVYGMRALTHQDLWLWGGTVLSGVLLGLYIALLESPPARIEHWRLGFEGERLTARALAPLRRRGYVLLHDLPDRRTPGAESKGNVDHVVVSPGGVFLLDSKRLGGDASIDGDTVHVQMRDDDEDSYMAPRLASAVRGRAVRLQQDLSQQVNVRFVQAVVVFWNGFDAGLVRGENVIFVHGDRLVDWLEQQQAEISLGRVADIAAHIRRARPSERPRWWERSWRVGLPRKVELGIQLRDSKGL